MPAARPSITFLRRGSAALTAAASAWVGSTCWLSWLSISFGSGWAMVILRGLGSGSLEPATEGADQLDVEGEGTGFELGDDEPRIDDALLRREHGEVGGQALLVAAAGDAKRVFISGQRAARLAEALFELFLARQRIGGFTQRLDDLAVIQSDGFVIL